MVYVDNLQACLVTRKWKYLKSCHLFADSISELTEFAKSIGLKIEWLQNKKIPHFDLNESKHKLAIKYGAKLFENRNELKTFLISQLKNLC